MRFRAVSQQRAHAFLGDASAPTLRGNSKFLNNHQVLRRSGQDPVVTGGPGCFRQNPLPWLVVNNSMGQGDARHHSGQVGNHKPTAPLRQLLRAPTGNGVQLGRILEVGGGRERSSEKCCHISPNLGRRSVLVGLELRCRGKSGLGHLMRLRRLSRLPKCYVNGAGTVVDMRARARRRTAGASGKTPRLLPGRPVPRPYCPRRRTLGAQGVRAATNRSGRVGKWRYPWPMATAASRAISAKEATMLRTAPVSARSRNHPCARVPGRKEASAKLRRSSGIERGTSPVVEGTATGA